MKRVDFENGTITSNILGASLPMLVAQILSLLYNIVDRIYIARIPHIGTAALGAVGLCFPVIVIITAFSNLFGSGGAPLFSIERGKNEPQEAKKIMNISFSMVCICAIVLMVIGFLFARPILVLFGASKDALIYAYPYLMLYLIGTLPSMIATGMNPFINAQGYSTIGMLSVTIGAVTNLLLDPYFHEAVESRQDGWRKVCAEAIMNGIPVPAFASALSYFDGYRSERLPANVLQAQRDYFGAHTYERLDSPRGEFFHTNWTGHGGNTAASTYNA